MQLIRDFIPSYLSPSFPPSVIQNLLPAGKSIPLLRHLLLGLVTQEGVADEGAHILRVGYGYGGNGKKVVDNTQ